MKIISSYGAGQRTIESTSHHKVIAKMYYERVIYLSPKADIQFEMNTWLTGTTDKDRLKDGQTIKCI